MAEFAYRSDDYNSFVGLTKAKRHSGVLSEATGGRLDRSVRYRELLRPSNVLGELRTSFVVDGAAWACVSFFPARLRLDELGFADGRVLPFALLAAAERVRGSG